MSNDDIAQAARTYKACFQEYGEAAKTWMEETKKPWGEFDAKAHTEKKASVEGLLRRVSLARNALFASIEANDEEE